MLVVETDMDRKSIYSVNFLHVNRLLSTWWFTHIHVKSIHFVQQHTGRMPKAFTTQFQLLTTLREMAIENMVRRGENDCNQHFLLFP